VIDEATVRAQLDALYRIREAIMKYAEELKKKDMGETSMEGEEKKGLDKIIEWLSMRVEEEIAKRCPECAG
jgi:hypothetical protein